MASIDNITVLYAERKQPQYLQCHMTFETCNAEYFFGVLADRKIKKALNLHDNINYRDE